MEDAPLSGTSNSPHLMASGSGLSLVSLPSQCISTKLDDSNYLIWKQQIMATIEGFALENFLIGTTAPPPNNTETNSEYIMWRRQDQLITSWLLSSMTPSVLVGIVGLSTSKEIWEALEFNYASQSRAKVMQLKYQLQTLKKGSLSMKDYLNKVKSCCDNAGAEFRHAVAADVSVSDILEAKYTPQIVYSFFPRDGVYNFQGVSAPLLAIQVTELADGIFIACSANHCVVDGTSFWHFINSWSQILREGFDTIISKLPVFDRGCAADDDRLLVHVPTVEQNMVSPPSPTAPQKLFHFSKETVANLKAKANSEASTHQISSLQAVLAHLWRSIIRCRWQSSIGGQEQVVRMLMAVGTRGRMASLPETYFGNAAYNAMLAIGEGELLDEKGLGHVALKINDLVSQQTNETAIRDVQKKVEFPVIRPGPTPLFIGGALRSDVYGNDFGWGKPIGVRNGETHKRDGTVVVFPAPEAGGIDLEVCLARETLEAMESDADFVGALT